MKEALKILIAGGFPSNKLENASKKLRDILSEKGMDITTVITNTFSNDIKVVEKDENPDIIVMIGTSTIKTAIPVINGLALLYPAMGLEKVIDEIKNVYLLIK